MTGTPATHASIGFTVKSGWASAVLLVGPASAPRVVDSRVIALSDPSDPDAKQPYHAGFGTARATGSKLKRLVDSVKRFGQKSVADVLREHRKTGYDLQGAGIVVGSLVDPATIGNDHIRIHALEGQLFRGVVNTAAARQKLPRTIYRERDLHASAVQALRTPDEEIRRQLTALGRELPGSWRAEQKAAALAAWIVLASRRPL
jgi:hypothetical protein